MGDPPIAYPVPIRFPPVNVRGYVYYVFLDFGARHTLRRTSSVFGFPAGVRCHSKADRKRRAPERGRSRDFAQTAVFQSSISLTSFPPCTRIFLRARVCRSK